MTNFDLLYSPLKKSNLIEANAGTGKTYTISKLFIRLLLEKKAAVNEILVVTFTEAATQELRERIWQDLIASQQAFLNEESEDLFFNHAVKQYNREESLKLIKNSIRLFDDISVFTIHGFCQKAIKENAFESGFTFDAELITNQDKLIQEICEDFWRRKVYEEEPEIVSFLLENTKGPEFFNKYLKRNLMTAQVSFLPETVQIDPKEIIDAIQQYTTILTRLLNVWDSSKQEIKILLSSDSLSKVSYKEDKIQALCEEIEGMATSETNPIISKNFTLLTQSSIDEKVKKNCTPPSHEFFSLAELVCNASEALNQLLESFLLSMRIEFISFVRNELDIRKKEQNVLFYDDLISRLNSSLLHNKKNNNLVEKLRKTYKAVLIDEFQDTDSLQYSIFNTLFENETILFLIGDPKQSIYSFRGADIFAYIKAAQEVKQKYSLTTNFRSDKKLVEAINRLFSASANPFVFEEISYHSSQTPLKRTEPLLSIDNEEVVPLKLCFVSREKDTKPMVKEVVQSKIIHEVGAEVAKLIKKGVAGNAKIEKRNLKANDIAILVRTHIEADKMKAHLDEMNIPSVVDSTEDIFKSEEAKELRLILLAIKESSNINFIKIALSTSIFGKDINEVLL
ncbi:MAG: UvrD-helicase domain-containing protein, partial [Nitrospinae bacterium]|nr:UvrD-helicase domain-containing protein [Nitrospinota bacterium]